MLRFRSLTSQAFGNCTVDVFGVNRVNGETIDNLPYAVGATSGGAIALTGGPGAIASTVSLGTILGNITCRYAPADATRRRRPTGALRTSRTGRPPPVLPGRCG